MTVASEGTGGGIFSLTPGNTLKFIIGVSDLTGALDLAHFHNAPEGVAAGVVRTLTGDFTDEGVATGEWTSSDGQALTDELVGQLLASRIYVNIHTAANGAGEVRGQVKAGGTVDFTTTLSSEVAIPPVAVASDGTGGGEFSLNVSGTELTYNIEVLESSLTGSITAAHFHNAPAGSQGDIVRDLQFGSTATGTWSSTEANQPLTPALVGQLLASRIYVNIHTAANGAGEVRGQVRVGAPIIQKLLLSEIVARPTDGEFVEIYNPGSVTVDLSNYYLANSTFQFGNTFYYQLVEGGGGGGSFADFNARFPDGAMIQPGEYQTIAISGDSLFFAVYSVLPTYELYEDGTNFGNDVPDMREAVPGSIAGQGGFSNGDEDAILFYWDGLSDLVVDIDYVIYDEGDGGINEQVDKTGVSIDGPDPGTDSTMYLPDTPIANQVPAPINNTADGFSTHRIDYTEGNQTPTGGNGVTGADETSEDLNNTFTDNSTPSPNAPGQIVGVEDLSIVIPDRFVLHGNYPNPFNPSTTIRYDLPTNADVRIVIFDILGRQVLTIENNNVSAGSALTIEINASELSSGLYFYQLIAKLKEKTEIKTGKMTLLK